LVCLRLLSSADPEVVRSVLGTTTLGRHIEDTRMQIDLTDEEWHTVRLVLNDYLPQLRREIARTEALDFRHALVKREEACEHLLDLLVRAEE